MVRRSFLFRTKPMPRLLIPVLSAWIMAISMSFLSGCQDRRPGDSVRNDATKANQQSTSQEKRDSVTTAREKAVSPRPPVKKGVIQPTPMPELSPSAPPEPAKPARVTKTRSAAQLEHAYTFGDISWEVSRTTFAASSTIPPLAGDKAKKHYSHQGSVLAYCTVPSLFDFYDEDLVAVQLRSIRPRSGQPPRFQSDDWKTLKKELNSRFGEPDGEDIDDNERKEHRVFYCAEWSFREINRRIILRLYRQRIPADGEDHECSHIMISKFSASVPAIFKTNTNEAPSGVKYIDDPKIAEVIDKLFAVDSDRQNPEGIGGYKLGSQAESLKGKLRSSKGQIKDEAWLDTSDDAFLYLDDMKLVGITKRFDGIPRDTEKDLVDRYGEPSHHRVIQFDSVPQANGRGVTGEHKLVRYFFPNTILYGFISTGIRANQMGPYLEVAIFDRNYLRRIIRSDLEQKVRLIEQSKSVIDWVLGFAGSLDKFDWEKIPFPQIKDGVVKQGANAFNERAAFLEGRSAPRSLTPTVPMKAAIFVHSPKNPDSRSIRVVICFNSFPEFEMHPLLAAREYMPNVWVPSGGLCSAENDAQRALVLWLLATFPANEKKLAAETVNDPISLLPRTLYQWETREGWTVLVTGNNTVAISKREKRKFD